MDNRKINVPIANAGKARKIRVRRMLNAPTIPVMVGGMGGFEKKPDPTSTDTEVLREIVKVRCKYLWCVES